ncbi:MAG TPA: hypothetical protein VH601_03580 [Bryobacteraceae bacterium]|jgi:hypothetical protein
MQSTGNPFLANEIKETEIAKPGAKVLSFEGRDLRDSVPVSADPSPNECYDLICIDNLVEKIRNGKASELLALLFSGLNPGGRLLVGSGAEAEGHELDVQDVEAISQLSASIPDREIGGQTVFKDQAGGIVFLEVYRKVA